jgi:hypothetical protein
VKIFDDDMRNFSWVYVFMFAAMAAIAIWAIVGAIVWGP